MHCKLDDVPQTLRNMHEHSSRLMLATGHQAQAPYVCHVPFVWADEGYYVWIANVTEPIHHLSLANQASVMLLQQGHGQQCSQLIWIVEAQEVVYPSPQYGELLASLAMKAGASLQDALTMECQAIYHLKPLQGRLITDLNEIIALIAEDLTEAMTTSEQKTIAKAIA